MRGAVIAMLLVGLADVAVASVRLADPAFLATIRDDEPTLPRGMTPFEQSIWRARDLSRAPLAPPGGTIDTPAEYERNAGLMIRWGQQNAILSAMAVAITTGEANFKLYVVVSAGLQASAQSTLTNAGANLSQVQFVIANSDSVWIRDYGPRFIDDNGRRAIVDHVYNRPRPNDDLVPGVFATLLGETKYDLPLSHGGGNFHLFEDGSAYMTSLIVNENPGATTQSVRDAYLAYQGLNLTVTDPMPVSFDSTQHIDMWMLPADGNRVIINEYPAIGGVYTTPRQVTEAVATQLINSGKTVLRIGGFSVGGVHYTYTNAVVLNSTVLTCQFNGYTTQNQNALSVFQQAFPTRAIVPIDCSNIIGLAGAIHCIVMHVPAVLLRYGFE